MTDPHLALLDDAVHAEAVADRARRRHITEADDQDASLDGSLRSLAESGASVIVDTTVSSSVHGHIDGVGDEYVRVRDTASTSYVRVEQITAVRGTAAAPLGRAAASGGASEPTGAVRQALGRLGLERSPVHVHLVGGTVVGGEVRRVGVDVLTVRSVVTGAETLVHLPNAVVISVHDGSAVVA